MDYTTVISFAVLLVSLTAFNCDSHDENRVTKVTETSAKPNFQGNEALYAYNFSILNVESDSSHRQKREAKGPGRRPGTGIGIGSGRGSEGASGSGSGTRTTTKNVRRGSRRSFSSGSESDDSTGVGAGSSASNSFESNSTIISGKNTVPVRVFGSGPKLVPVPVTDEDIETFTSTLWQSYSNNVNRFITVTRGQRDANGILTIEQPLLQVDQRAFNITTIAEVREMHNRYKLDITEAESMSEDNKKAEDLLIEDLTRQPVITEIITFLENKGFIHGGMGKEILNQIWFGLYSREGPGGNETSSGFQHVFLAEIKPGTPEKISGLHNWLYFNANEVAGKLVYKSCIRNIRLGTRGSILLFRATFKTENGESINMPRGVMFIGTSPEMEIALYTLCFFVRPNGKCPVSLDGNKLNILTKSVIRNGKKMVRTAYPQVVSSTMGFKNGC